MLQVDVNKWYRHEVFNNRDIYPNLYEIEIKKNQWNQFKREFYSRQRV